jgi:hypothetical protein
MSSFVYSSTNTCQTFQLKLGLCKFDIGTILAKENYERNG